MPLYEYQCQACGESCEVLQKVSDDPKTECPHCHKEQLKKQISAAAFHLKGSGWYVTDFRKDANKKDDKKASTDSGAKNDTKSDTSKANSDTKATVKKDDK